MVASCFPRAQAVIAFNVCLWFMAQSKGLRRFDVRPAGRLSVDQSVQEVQHMGLCGDTLGQGHFHGDQHGLFIVMQDQRQDIDHPLVGRRCKYRREALDHHQACAT